MKPRDPREPAPKKPAARKARRKETLSGLLGVGLDGQDGHRRVTQGEDFLLVGGSTETHERMQDLVIRMDEKLKRTGKRFADLSRREFEALARETLR
jgi:hypothetical protein